MRGVELALSLLLVGGISNGHPQYGQGTGPEAPFDVTDTGCPAYTHDCVPFYQCNADGEINTDGAGLIDVRIRPKKCTNPEYPDVHAVCCKIPGVTPPPTPAPLQTCPAGLVCIEQGQCNSNGIVSTDGSGLIQTACYDPVSLLVGICCQPPTPPPVTICPEYKVCVAEEQCTSPDASYSSVSYTSCVLDASYYATGVCCDPPIPVFDVCPGDAVCLPEILCQGDILDVSNNYVPYSSSGPWSQCALSGDLQTPGVCCRSLVSKPPVTQPPYAQSPVTQSPYTQPPVTQAPYTQPTVTQPPYTQPPVTQPPYNQPPVTQPPYTQPSYDQPPYNPYTPATKCGIRHDGLNVRSQVKLEKNEAQFGEFPWQAVLFFSNYTFKCGASLVDDRWLITGAHCVSGYQYGDFKVRLGEYQVNTYDEPLPYVDVDIASITIHPGFNPTNLHNDVAVIELTAPVPLQYHINTVCLPSPGQIPLPGTRCFASGWGKDAFEGAYQARLKKVDVPFVEYSYCQDLLRYTRLGKYFQLDKSFMCAGGEENKDACTGDGGGPLVCEDPASGSYFLQGITAWGINCGQKNIPGVYADVQYFSNWIKDIIYGGPVAEVNQPGNNPYGRK